MCGIVGTVRVNADVSVDAFARQAERWLTKCDRLLFHRGPDSGGTLIEDRVALGARRLRIHDLSVMADQPFQTADGRIALVFNGAIFNFRDLREELKTEGHAFTTDCDTETIAVGYAAWGERIFERLDGMFAVAILDRSRKRLVLARDKLGIKPLYIVRNSEFWAFSSEIKPLLAHPEVPREVNSDAVSEQLAFQFVMPPRTLFKGIEVFMPGHVASVDLVTGETETRAYWQIDGDLIESEGAPSLRTRSKVRFGDVGTRTAPRAFSFRAASIQALFVSCPANGWVFMTTQHFRCYSTTVLQNIICRAAEFHQSNRKTVRCGEFFLDLRCGGRSTSSSRGNLVS